MLIEGGSSVKAPFRTPQVNSSNPRCAIRINVKAIGSTISPDYASRKGCCIKLGLTQ